MRQGLNLSHPILQNPEWVLKRRETQNRNADLSDALFHIAR